MKVLLISTYEVGRQPFGLASPAAWLREHGHEVFCADVAINPLPSGLVREAELVALYLPMHTATRLAAQVVSRVRALNPSAYLCAYGLYAPLNEEYLRNLGIETVLGGESEPALVSLAARLAAGERTQREPLVSLDRLLFVPPDRSTLPALSRYPKLRLNGSSRVSGYTEASRGCKHMCRHCPVVPVYKGVFRVVQRDVVMEDIRRQVESGARHITFGDPDFFNGPLHARRVAEEFYAAFPDVSYDVTIKIEHLLRHRDLLPVLRDTGCLFITTAVESVDDAVLTKLEKGHTTADFIEAVGLCREHGLTLAPTFIPFTPWTTREGYSALLQTVAGLGLIENVSTVQLALRLLIPSGSRLLELAELRSVTGPFDASLLTYPWRHPDPEVERLAEDVLSVVNAAQRARTGRLEAFGEIWELVHGARLPENYRLLPRTVIPYMDEPWFC